MRVVLVEDDAALTRAVTDALGRAGLKVEPLDRAERADAVLSCTAYDLLILDIGLPGMSGLELFVKALTSHFNLVRLPHRADSMPAVKAMVPTSAQGRSVLQSASPSLDGALDIAVNVRSHPHCSSCPRARSCSATS